LRSGEKEAMEKIAANVYFPNLENTNIFLQQDGFTDKELLNANDLPDSERPINQHWSWDRILRSVFIKQADVLQDVYLFEDHFSDEVIKDNFYYYEPKTVHESSLSPCVHAILACPPRHAILASYRTSGHRSVAGLVGAAQSGWGA
jgi:maltose phosphorylase